MIDKKDSRSVCPLTQILLVNLTILINGTSLFPYKGFMHQARIEESELSFCVYQLFKIINIVLIFIFINLELG